MKIRRFAHTGFLSLVAAVAAAACSDAATSNDAGSLQPDSGVTPDSSTEQDAGIAPKDSSVTQDTGSDASVAGEHITAAVDGAPMDFNFTARGYFTAGSSATQVVGQRASPAVGVLTINFKGQAPGTFACSKAADASLITYLGPNTGGVASSFSSWTAGTNCSIVVTKVDAVGGMVEGTFSADVKAGAQTISLTNGDFKVKRVADQ